MSCGSPPKEPPCFPSSSKRRELKPCQVVTKREDGYEKRDGYDDSRPSSTQYRTKAAAEQPNPIVTSKVRTLSVDEQVNVKLLHWNEHCMAEQRAVKTRFDVGEHDAPPPVTEIDC